MNHFFENNNWRKVALAGNVAALGVAAYNFYSNPLEEGSSLMVHLVSLADINFSLNGRNDMLTNFTAAGINLFSLGFLFAATASGFSARPLALNLADMVLHLVNTSSSVVSALEASDKRREAPALKN